MKKKKVAGLMIGICCGAAVALIAGGIVYQKAGEKYKEIFFPNTYINGIDCSGLTAEEAQTLVLAQEEDYSIEIDFRENKKETIKGDEINYTFVVDGDASKFLLEQDTSAWGAEMKATHEYTISTHYTFDENLLDQKVKGLKEMNTVRMRKPKDAELSYDTKQNQYVVTSHDDGTTLDVQKAEDLIRDNVKEGAHSVDLTKAEGVYSEAGVKSDNTLLNTQKDQLNLLANAHITYKLVDETKVEITPELLKSWLVMDEAGNYTRTEEFDDQLLAFITNISSALTSKDDKQLFDSTLDGTVEVEMGKYSNFSGFTLDLEAEFALAKQEIDEHAIVEREPTYQTTGSTGNHGIGKTYAEVNLTRQHMWYYQDGVMVFEANIVSGSMTTWRYTPAGIYKLAVKSSPHTMKGEVNPATGQPIYTATCTYWMNFIPQMGIGFHDYDSRGNWSSSAIWNYDGSHGCINMHGYDAKQLYSLIEVGCPVVVYYTEPYTLTYEMSTAEKAAAGYYDSSDETVSEEDDNPIVTPDSSGDQSQPETQPETQPEAQPDAQPETPVEAPNEESE